MVALTPQENSMIHAIDQSIKQVQTDYMTGHSFFFYSEEDARCRLFSRLIANLGDPDLVHGEHFCCTDKSYLDLAIWEPSLLGDAEATAGTPNSTMLETRIPGLVFAGIEIVNFQGGSKKARPYATFASCSADTDVCKLTTRLSKGTVKQAYFLMFWDDDVLSDPGLKALMGNIGVAFGNLNRQSGLHSSCISRDGGGFTH